MPLELPYLLASTLLAMAILACLWLTLNSKAEFRSREKSLERRVNLLEERLELVQPALASARALASLPAQTITPSFSYQVSIPQRKAPAVSTQSRAIPTRLPEQRPVMNQAATSSAPLMPEQLEFLSSLKSGRPAI